MIYTILQTIDILVLNILWYFSGWILRNLRWYQFPVAQVQCLSEYKVVENRSSFINMNIYKNYLWCIVEKRYTSNIEHYNVFLGWYWSIYDNIHFLLLRLSVLVITKLYENSYSYINIKKLHQSILPYCRRWISWYHRSFDIFLWCLLANIHWYPFLVTQLKFLGEHNIVDKLL